MIVVKIGGSILTGLGAYHRAAQFLQRRLSRLRRSRLLAVVSAQHGETDALLQLAKQVSAQPDASALDLLWSAGEVRSVALLTIALQARGIPAAGLNIHQTGLLLPDEKGGPANCDLEPRWIRTALATHAVAVVPGFLAVRPSGAIVSLGRGGSDLTAVLLAAKLGATRCELVKDVPGYFDRDPNRHTGAVRIRRLSFERALQMARDGCDLVQREAIETAARCRLPLRVGSLDPRAPWSRVGPHRRTRRAHERESLPLSSWAESISLQQETTP